MKLYEINEIYMNIKNLLEDGEIEQEQVKSALENVEDELEVKAENYAIIMKELDAQAKSIKEEEDRLAKRRKSLESNSKWLKEQLEYSMNLQGKRNFKTKLFSFGIQKNPKSVKLDVDPSLLDKRFKKITITGDKTESKKARESGEKIEGAELVQTEGLRIR